MFGFLLRKKQDDVHRLFAGCMNRRAVQNVRDGLRSTSRGAFCEVVWLIPISDETGEPAYSSAIPVVTKDICQKGVAVIHTQQIPDERVLLGLECDVSVQFVLCHVHHATEMGYGFYHIGLEPLELINVPPGDEREFSERRRQFEVDPQARTEAETVLT